MTQSTNVQLAAVIQEIAKARDLPALMDIVKHAACNLIDADGVTFVLRENDRCYYVDELAVSPLWKGERFPMSACISGWAMMHRQSVVIEDIYADDRIPHDVYAKTFVKSLAMAPIRRHAPVGALGIYWGSHHRASPEEMKLLQTLADSTAAALENAALSTELDDRFRQSTGVR